MFTALHKISARTSHEKTVCPSVKRMDCDKTEDSSAQIFIPSEIWVNWPRWSKNADFQSIFARIAPYPKHPRCSAISERLRCRVRY